MEITGQYIKTNYRTKNKPKLLDQVRQVIRVKHYSLRTEEAYLNWIKRFIFFHNKKHPIEMGEKEIGEFITHRIGSHEKQQLLFPLVPLILCYAL